MCTGMHIIHRHGHMVRPDGKGSAGADLEAWTFSILPDGSGPFDRKKGSVSNWKPHRNWSQQVHCPGLPGCRWCLKKKKKNRSVTKAAILAVSPGSAGNRVAMKGERLVIPDKEMLDKIHKDHQGVTKCTTSAQQSSGLVLHSMGSQRLLSQTREPSSLQLLPETVTSHTWLASPATLKETRPRPRGP